MSLLNIISNEDDYEKGNFNGWVINEGGRIVLEFLHKKVNYVDKPRVNWSLRLFILGVSFQLQWLHPFAKH